jgi:hypothetical protein
MATGLPHTPEAAAVAAARTIALQMLEERGRGAVLVGVARVDAALEHLLQALMAPGLRPTSETFRVLKTNEIRQFGEYRTQRLVLEAWDRLFGGG